MVMSKKVLLVDDSRTALMLASMALSQRATYSLVTAGDGQEAIEKAASELPDLILMDLVMPRKNGFEACKAIRENPQTSEIPIILLTTRGEADCVEAGFLNGCNDYLTKPINEKELLNMVEAYIGK